MALEGSWVVLLDSWKEAVVLVYEIVSDVAGYRAGGDVFLSDKGLLLGGQVQIVLVLQRQGHQ